MNTEQKIILAIITIYGVALLLMIILFLKSLGFNKKLPPPGPPRTKGVKYLKVCKNHLSSLKPGRLAVVSKECDVCKISHIAIRN